MEVVQEDQQEEPYTREYYLDEDDSTKYEDLEELCEASVANAGGPFVYDLVVPMTPKKYHSLFQIW